MEIFSGRNGGNDRKLSLDVVIKSILGRVGPQPNSFSFGFLTVGVKRLNQLFSKPIPFGEDGVILLEAR
jgi:hypothetical protein